jgi:hypothetical protein
LATINLTESRLACRRDQYRLARMFLAVAGRTPGDDLDDPGAEADQHPQLPGAVIGAECIEDQPAAPRAEARLRFGRFIGMMSGEENTYFLRAFEGLGVTEDRRASDPDTQPTIGFKAIMREAAAIRSHPGALRAAAAAAMLTPNASIGRQAVPVKAGVIRAGRARLFAAGRFGDPPEARSSRRE